MSMTFGNRIVAALLTATLLFSLGYLIVGSIPKSEPASKTTILFDGYLFNNNEKGAAQSMFSNKGLNDHNWIGNQLQVPTSKKAQYTAALAEAKVPETTGNARQDTAKGLTPWDSAKIMDKRMIASTEKDCENAIRMVGDFIDVQVTSNKRPAWERNVWARTQITSVSVTVKNVENNPISDNTISSISSIVSRSFGITNLKEISIIDAKHGRSYDGAGKELGSASGEYVRHQKRVQDEWNDKIYQHLSHIDGLKVETSVKLTTYETMQEFGVEHGKPTALTMHELDYHFKKEGYDRFFRPGQIAQWSRPLIDPTGNVSPKDLVDEKKREAEVTHALQGTETKTEELPFIPLQITASISIPREHLLKRWKERNRLFGDGDPDAKPTPEQLLEEENELTLATKESVGKLFEQYRLSNKVDPMELVHVSYSIAPRETEHVLTAWEQFVLFLQENWKNLGLMSLVFCGMAVLYLISKPQKPDTIAIIEGMETPLEAIDARIAEKRRLEEERLAAEAAAAAAEEQEMFENSLDDLGSIRSLRDEIAELIAKNPEAAAAVIRQWIGNAVLVEAKT